MAPGRKLNRKRRVARGRRLFHRWRRFPDMRPCEAVPIKFHDAGRGVASRCIHTAFFDDGQPNPKTRECMEINLIA